MARIPRSVLIAGLTAMLGLAPSPAPAALAAPALLGKPKPPLEGKKPIAVGTIAGKRAGKVRALIFERLKESNAYEVADTEDLKPGDNKTTIAKNAKALKVSGVVMGRVSEKYDLTLVIYNATGKLVREVTIKGGTPQKLENAVRNEFDLLAGEAIAQATGGKNLAEAKPAPTEVIEEEEEAEPGAAEEEPKEQEKAEEEEEKSNEDEPKKEEEEDDGDKKDEKPAKAGATPFELIAGLRLYNRQFAYSGAQTELFPYKLGLGPALLVGGRIYPAAFFRDDFLGNIGLTARGELGIATDTDFVTPVPGGGERIDKLSNSAQEWDVGLVVRFPFDPVELDIFAVYGQQTFIVKGDEGGSELPPLVPDVKYGYFRPGLEGRVGVSKFFGSVHVAPRFVTSLHQLDLDGVWFPGATGSGFDFGLTGGWGVLPFLDVVAGFDFVRYGFDFSAIPKDRPPCANVVIPPDGCQKVATGASDTYISGWLGVRLHVGGTSADQK